MTDLTQNVTLLLLGALIIVLGLMLAAYLASHHSTNPTIGAIEDALDKYIYTAILAGERLVLQSEQNLDATLTDSNRAKVANAVWDLLPKTIVVGTFTLDVDAVKRLVGQERWEAMVAAAYNEAHAFILQNETYLKRQIGALPAPKGS